MVSLELLIDATGMQRGADQAKAALGSLQTQAKATEAAVSGVAGRGGSNPFGAFNSSGLVGNFIQVGSGISQAAKAFGDLNVASGLFNSARLVSDLSQLSGSMQVFRAATAAGATSFTALGIAMKANPVLAIVSVLSTAAAAMSLFGNNTEKAVDALGKLRETNLRLDVESQVAGTFGLNDVLQSVSKRRADARFETAVDIGVKNEPVGYDSLLAAFGGDRNALTRALQRTFTGDPFNTPQNQYNPYALGPAGFPQGVPPNAAISALGYDPSMVVRGQSTIPITSQSGPDWARTNYPLRPTEQEDRDYERREQANQEMRENLRAMVDDARQVGEYLGDGAADMILGLRSGREILAAMLQDLVRMGVRQAAGGLFAAVANSFGQTPAQTTPAPGAPGSNIQLP